MEAKPIKRIELSGLLDKYSLNWELNDDVNILVGINGSGKSTVLRSIDALLSKKYSYLNNKKTGINISIKLIIGDLYQEEGLSEATDTISYEKGITQGTDIKVKYDFITTFDIPIRDKKAFRQTETPLDKELNDLIYTVGKERPSFSNYRFKATNFPTEAKKINTRIKNLFKFIDEIFSETNKKINIDPDTNEVYFRRNGSHITMEQLSSGEKQILIILFSVFLMEEQPYILLMDEPDISLHISWQQKLIDIIHGLNPNCQLIMSTHSPSIFGKGWGDKIFFIEDLMTLTGK